MASPILAFIVARTGMLNQLVATLVGIATHARLGDTNFKYAKIEQFHIVPPSAIDSVIKSRVFWITSSDCDCATPVSVQIRTTKSRFVKFAIAMKRNTSVFWFTTS